MMKWERRELREELSHKKLENFRRWQELFQKRLNKKSEMFTPFPFGMEHRRLRKKNQAFRK